MRPVVLHMETEAKTTPTNFVAQRKHKGLGNTNTTSSDLRPRIPWQCHLQTPFLPSSVKPPYSRFSILKVFLLVTLVVLLFHNIVSPLFSYPSLFNFSSLSSSPYTSPSSSNIISLPLHLNSYSPDSTYPSPPPPPPPPPPSPPPPPQPSLEFVSPPSLSPSLSPSFDLVSPPPPPQQPSLEFVSPPSKKNSSSPSISKHGRSKGGGGGGRRRRRRTRECDLSQGEWIRDWQAPYYTNLTCQTIQEHQNCMKFGRPNLDFLKWRWKPDRCELPRFEPNQFLELMRGKSIAFVGDSLARNQMQSLICLLSRVAYQEDISETSRDENFKIMHYPAFNFTIRIFWSPFLIRARLTRGPGGFRLWNFYLDEIDEVWASHIDKFDYVIISGGNWFNRPSVFYQKGKIVGCLYCPSERVVHLTMHYSHQRAFRTAFKTINRSDKFKGTVILRSVSPHHFENGPWDKGGDCVRTRPFQRNETHFQGDDLNLYKAQISEYHRAKKEGKKKGIAYMLLDATNAMLLRPDGHPSRYGHWPDANVVLYNDCVHWCLPGPVDVLNDILLQMLSV